MELFSDDNSFLIAFQQDDVNAVRQIYDRHYRTICYYAERFVQNRAEAEDIAIDSFIKLLKKKNEFGSLAEIKSFLFIVTRNACFDSIRREKRHHSAHKELLYMSDVMEPDQDLEGIRSEVMQEIFQEVENLPPQCGQVFKLLFLRGLDSKTAAAELGIATKTVLNQKAKAILLLRKALLKKGLIGSILLFDMLLTA